MPEQPAQGDSDHWSTPTGAAQHRSFCGVGNILTWMSFVERLLLHYPEIHNCHFIFSALKSLLTLVHCQLSAWHNFSNIDCCVVGSAFIITYPLHPSQWRCTWLCQTSISQATKFWGRRIMDKERKQIPSRTWVPIEPSALLFFPSLHGCLFCFVLFCLI